jgi:glycosyltransferase involved in cell wall biosynthesis
MKLVFVLTSMFFPSYAGGDKSDQLMITDLVRRGHVCRVIVGVPVSSPQDKFERIENLRGRGITSVSLEEEIDAFMFESVDVYMVSMGRLRSFLEQQQETFRPDLIITSTDPSNVIISYVTNMSRVKVIYLARTTMLLPFGPDAQFPSLLRTEAVRRADVVVAVSEYLSDYIYKYSGILAVHIPIDLIASTDGISCGAFDNPFVTMINPCALKGISVFLGLADIFTEVEFAAVPTWGTTINDRVALESRSNIRLLGPVDDIRIIFRQSKVLLVPSLWAEAWGRIALESMLYGVPVLVSARGGLPEATMGLPCVLPVTPIAAFSREFDERKLRVPIVPIQNMQPWRDGLAKLLTDSEYYTDISKASRLAAQNYINNNDLTAFEAIMNELVS